jgi:zinc transporter ZupT
MDGTEFFKMNIFFVVTTTVVALVGILAGVLGYYLIRIARDIRDITVTVKKQAQGLADDFESVRTDIREGVHEVRENVTEGIATATSYTKAVAGAGIVRAIAHLFEAFSAEKGAREPNRRRKRTATKGE